MLEGERRVGGEVGACDGLVTGDDDRSAGPPGLPAGVFSELGALHARRIERRVDRRGERGAVECGDTGEAHGEARRAGQRLRRREHEHARRRPTKHTSDGRPYVHVLRRIISALIDCRKRDDRAVEHPTQLRGLADGAQLTLRGREDDVELAVALRRP